MVKAKDCRKIFSDKAVNSKKEDPNMPIFFYMPDSKPYGVFCQWFPAEFTTTLESLIYLKRPHVAIETWSLQIDNLWTKLPPTTKSEEGQRMLKFKCAEQYHMLCKALCFSDFDIAARIMATPDPKTQKRLGQQINDYVRPEWHASGLKVAETANYAKFTQNTRLKHALLRTENRQLCETASKDDVWGIGLNENAAAITWNGGQTKQWGQNLLGKALMAVRERIRREEEENRRWGAWDCYDEV